MMNYQRQNLKRKNKQLLVYNFISIYTKQLVLQKEATQEQLAHTLTVIRRRMKDSGQVIVAVAYNLSTAADPTNVANIQNGVNSVFRLAAIVAVIGLVLVIFVVRPKMTAKKAE